MPFVFQLQLLNICFFSVKEKIVMPNNLTLVEFTHEYNKLYQEGIDLFTKHNICDVYDNTCLNGRESSKISFCCGGCQYLSNNGCTTNALWCKLWLCATGRIEAGKIAGFLAKRGSLLRRFYKLCPSGCGRLNLSDYVRRYYYKVNYV